MFKKTLFRLQVREQTSILQFISFQLSEGRLFKPDYERNSTQSKE
jgi:hypothetical protein